MLILKVPGVESFNDETQEFVTSDETLLKLEHSLVSLSKWESRWEKPFISDSEKTSEELLDYIQAMSLEGEIPEDVLSRFSDENVTSINNYIESKMTATWFNEAKKQTPGFHEVVTAEIIYYWMVSLNIDLEWENRHLNQLITLIKVINEKNAAASDTKRRAPTKSDLATRRALNEQRRMQANTSG